MDANNSYIRIDLIMFPQLHSSVIGLLSHILIGQQIGCSSLGSGNVTRKLVTIISYGKIAFVLATFRLITPLRVSGGSNIKPAMLW